MQATDIASGKKFSCIQLEVSRDLFIRIEKQNVQIFIKLRQKEVFWIKKKSIRINQRIYLENDVMKV